MNDLQAAQAQIKARQKKEPEPKSVATFAQEILANLKTNNRFEEHRERRERDAQELRETKTAVYRDGFRRSLPQRYQEYLKTVPTYPHTRDAVAALAKLELGQSVHLYGNAGTSKTHLAVWGGLQLIERFCVSVKYVSGRAYLRGGFRNIENEIDMLSPQVIIVDDIDKGTVNVDNVRVVAGIYERPEHGLTLITTANRDNAGLVDMWGGDAINADALASRMSWMDEYEIAGDDYRMILAAERSVN